MAPKRSSTYQTSAFPVTMFAHLVAVAVTTLMLVWLLHFRGGFAFKSNNTDKIFNVHPLFMVIGFVLVSGEAIMAYKSFPGTRNSQKLTHLVLHFIALVCAIIGLYAVFKSHHDLRFPDMVSLHSWLGISTVSIFALQWVFSFFTFWYPRAEQSVRARLAVWHGVLGVVIFLMAILSATTGLSKDSSLRQSQESLIVNFTGMLILLFAISVGLTVFLPR